MPSKRLHIPTVVTRHVLSMAAIVCHSHPLPVRVAVGGTDVVVSLFVFASARRCKYPRPDLYCTIPSFPFSRLMCPLSTVSIERIPKHCRASELTFKSSLIRAYSDCEPQLT